MQQRRPPIRGNGAKGEHGVKTCRLAPPDPHVNLWRFDMAGKSSGRGRARSARTGRYVTRATAARHPKSTVIETGPNKGSGSRSRSAITGRFVTSATARRHPGSTVTENG